MLIIHYKNLFFCSEGAFKEYHFINGKLSLKLHLEIIINKTTEIISMSKAAITGVFM